MAIGLGDFAGRPVITGQRTNETLCLSLQDFQGDSDHTHLAATRHIRSRPFCSFGAGGAHCAVTYAGRRSATRKSESSVNGRTSQVDSSSSGANPALDASSRKWANS